MYVNTYFHMYICTYACIYIKLYIYISVFKFTAMVIEALDTLSRPHSGWHNTDTDLTLTVSFAVQEKPPRADPTIPLLCETLHPEPKILKVCSDSMQTSLPPYARLSLTRMFILHC